MNIKEKIRILSDVYAEALDSKMISRMEEMELDDNSHYLIYRVLGISNKEGKLIDQYQNKGRFVYNYAGAFLEQAAILCINEKYPKASKQRIPNTLGRRPKTFEIDCLVGLIALEIKWRDATTDGDHITKEHTRLQVIKDAGYKPIRIMFYYPNRSQAQNIQETLKTLYAGVQGDYYSGNEAWKFIKDFTDCDLLSILTEIAQEKSGGC